MNVALNQRLGNLARRDHNLIFIQIKGASAPVASRAAPHIQDRHACHAKSLKSNYEKRIDLF